MGLCINWAKLGYGEVNIHKTPRFKVKHYFLFRYVVIVSFSCLGTHLCSSSLRESDFRGRGRKIWWITYYPSWASPMARQVKNPPAMQEMQVWSLDWIDLLEEGMATHSSILAGTIPWTKEPGGLQSMVSKKSYMTELTENACTTSQRLLSKSDSSLHISLAQLVIIYLKELDGFKELP